MPIQALRTPDDRFRGLPDWEYVPHYLDGLAGCEGLRLHYVDEGPRRAGTTFLCLHGEPTWAYLYRKMIPVFVAAGCRVVAPDFFGFGRSDKPVDDDVYTFGFHREALKALIERLDLEGLCLVVQDWGGVLGLTLPMEYPERITRLLVMNTGVATGRSPGPAWEAWRAYAEAHPDLDVAGLIRGVTPVLSEAEAAAYAAPFPDVRYKAGVRRFPEIVPIRPDMEGADTGKAALRYLSEHWSGATFMAIGGQDRILGEPIMRALAGRIRGCPEPMVVADGGHFLQEWGEPVAREALRYFQL